MKIEQQIVDGLKRARDDGIDAAILICEALAKNDMLAIDCADALRRFKGLLSKPGDPVGLQ